MSRDKSELSKIGGTVPKKKGAAVGTVRTKGKSILSNRNKTKAKSSAVATAARPAKKRGKGRESWLLITGSDASRSSNVVLDEVHSNGFPSEAERIVFMKALSDIEDLVSGPQDLEDE